MPKVSIIVIFYHMKRQAMNTLASLSVLAQKNVSESDYEIIAIENSSPEMLDPDAIKAIGGNIRYFAREEASKSPAAAINFALEKAKAPFIGLMIDGARLVTPRVVEYSIMASRINQDCLVSVPGYFIGPCEHQFSDLFNYSEEKEINYLEKIRWQENPYRLFDFCTMSAANPRGVFIPFMECNCIFTSLKNFKAIGGANERFDLPGGGAINSHIFFNLAALRQCEPFFILPGEGSFHQLHNGVTTSPKKNRNDLLHDFKKQLQEICGINKFRSICREPVLLGSVTSHSMKFLKFSSQRGQQRFRRLTRKNHIFWPDDLKSSRYTEQTS